MQFYVDVVGMLGVVMAAYTPLCHGPWERIYGNSGRGGENCHHIEHAEMLALILNYCNFFWGESKTWRGGFPPIRPVCNTECQPLRSLYGKTWQNFYDLMNLADIDTAELNADETRAEMERQVNNIIYFKKIEYGNAL